MTDQSEATRAGTLVRAVTFRGAKGQLGSMIYGTILVMAALTAAYAAERHEPTKLIELVVSAVVVFWAAYVYAHALSMSIESGSRLSRRGVAHIAGQELGIVLAAVAPVAALLFGATGVIDESTSVWLAIALGLTTLTVQGYRYARIASLNPAGTIAILVVNFALGASVVLLKVALVH
jgi:hypothetical protein